MKHFFSNITTLLSAMDNKKRKFKHPIKLIDIKTEIKTLDDLISLGENYTFNRNEVYALDMIKLQKLIVPLKKLRDMIGMESVKKVILTQMIFFLSELATDDFMHTVIDGPPGCGKTSLAVILADIYHALGFISSNKFTIAKRADLIAGYLGQTALKTRDVIQKAENGVLFIDEAYSLGNAEGRDSFAKEAIDTLNQYLSEWKGKFICIIAGYKEELEKCFFSMNPGLRRRFTYSYTIEPYTADDLSKIFIKKVRDNYWLIEQDSIRLSVFGEKELFNFSGGDVETLFAMVKMAHSKRIFGKHNLVRKMINLEDFDAGVILFRNIKNNKTNERPPFGMYM